MRYTLESDESERDYLRNLRLSRSGRLCVSTALLEMVAEVPDWFRSDPANRLGSSSPYYHFTRIFKDGRHFKTLHVVVDDSKAVYGVLRIVYVECR